MLRIFPLKHDRFRKHIVQVVKKFAIMTRKDDVYSLVFVNGFLLLHGFARDLDPALPVSFEIFHICS